MKFLSIKEASAIWNMDISQIGKLLRAGKIPEAIKIGGHWVIPNGTPKPLDGRTTAGKSKKEPDSFRYPIFEYRDASAFNPPLCEEELIIKSVSEAIYACHFEEANNILGNLPETATDRYHRIITLYLGCVIDILFCNLSRFFERYGKLRAELTEDFPHKNEMKEYIHELDSTLGEDKYFVSEFKVDCTYSYHESFLPHLATLCTVSLSSPSGKPTAAEIKNAELNCIFVQNHDAYADLQSIHIYLGNAYTVLDNREAANFHFTKALEIAEKYDIFFSLATQYTYMRKAISKPLSAFSTDFKKKLEKHSDALHKSYMIFLHEANLTSIYELFTHDEYVYLQYAMQGLSNKEVARKMHISVGTVGKRYGEIYALLGVKNKKEMKELYYSLYDKKADNKTKK